MLFKLKIKWDDFITQNLTSEVINLEFVHSDGITVLPRKNVFSLEPALALVVVYLMSMEGRKK